MTELNNQWGGAVASAPSGVRRRDATARVLHLVNGEYYTGPERVQDLLALRLPDFGYEVVFACLRPGRFPLERMSQDASMWLSPMRHRLDLSPTRQITRLIRSEDCRVLHAHSPRTALLGGLAAALTGVPLVYHVHSPAKLDSTRRWQNQINALVELLSMRRATRLICASASLAEHVRQAGFRAAQISVVPNGVAAPRHVQRRSRPASTWTLGTVALFRPRKGIEVLVEALARLLDQGMPVRLRLVGPFEAPHYAATIKSLVRDRGLEPFVDWVGSTNDVYAELARIDLFVLPSLFGEGLPMALLEAMAAGVPVVGTNVEGIPEAIRNGREGLIVRPHDPGDLARAIAGLIRGDYDWSIMGSSARARHRELFSDASMAAGVAEIYDEIVFA